MCILALKISFASAAQGFLAYRLDRVDLEQFIVNDFYSKNQNSPLEPRPSIIVLGRYKLTVKILHILYVITVHSCENMNCPWKHLYLMSGYGLTSILP